MITVLEAKNLRNRIKIIRFKRNVSESSDYFLSMNIKLQYFDDLKGKLNVQYKKDHFPPPTRKRIGCIKTFFIGRHDFVTLTMHVSYSTVYCPQNKVSCRNITFSYVLSECQYAETFSLP